IGIWIIGESDVILILKIHETCHRIGTRWVHAYLTVVIDSHERESRIDCGVRNSDVQMIDGVNWPPVRLGGTTERIHTQFQTSSSDYLHIDDVFQILDIRQHEILLMCRVSLDCRSKRHALYACPVA